eukprot:5223501-Prymnesium_polylepis.1
MAHQTTIVTRTQHDSSGGSPFPCVFLKLKKASCPSSSYPRSPPECNTSPPATPGLVRRICTALTFMTALYACARPVPPCVTGGCAVQPERARSVPKRVHVCSVSDT